ncbi:hypothetical protein ABBQ32_014066 [Trebouxia sp. C0010 RCD-2024]
MFLKEQVPVSKRQKVVPDSPDETQAANAALSAQSRRHSRDSMASLPTPASCSKTLPSSDILSPVSVLPLTEPHQIVKTLLDPQRPVWASLYEALATPGTTTLEAWFALDTAWTAMIGPNTAEEALSHMWHMASSLHRLASTPGWTQRNFPVGLSMAVMLHIRRENYCQSHHRGRQGGVRELLAMNAIADALYSFADTLEDLRSSYCMCEVLKECQELSPRHWGALEAGLHASVFALGSAKLGRQRTIFTVAAWCNVAKMVVIIDSFRHVLHTLKSDYVSFASGLGCDRDSRRRDKQLPPAKPDIV